MKKFSIRAHLKTPIIFRGPVTLDALLMSVLVKGDVSHLLHCDDDLYFASAGIPEHTGLEQRAAFVASMRPEHTPEWLDVIRPNTKTEGMPANAIPAGTGRLNDVVIGVARQRTAGNILSGYWAKTTPFVEWHAIGDPEAVMNVLKDVPYIGKRRVAGYGEVDHWELAIPKTPYLRPTILDERQVTRYLDSKVVAIRRTYQGLHRGLRTPDAHCTLLLLDPRSGRDELREAIPARFKVDWESFEEGSLVVRTHLAEEKIRSAALRNAALKHHGAQCSYAGCQVAALHLLDVHHLVPISHGERKTALTDVVVLCKNHHADAHHQMRMTDLANRESGMVP